MTNTLVNSPEVVVLVSPLDCDSGSEPPHKNSYAQPVVRCSDPRRFNVYEYMRSRLTAGGIPENAIAFIHDADSDQAKMNLFNAVTPAGCAS